jgi:hypothetical protein
MGRCIRHPDVETDLVCLKDNIYVCEECAFCRNPKQYCKFRQACAIWFAEHGGDDGVAPEKGAEPDDREKRSE